MKDEMKQGSLPPAVADLVLVRPMKCVWLLSCVTMFAFVALAARWSPAATATRSATFAEIVQTVRENFFDPQLRGLDWNAVTARYRPHAEAAPTADEFASVVNDMLSELHSSHTHYYTPESPEYFQLSGIFWPTLAPKLAPRLPMQRPNYVGIGISTVSRNGKTFVSDVLAGSPAAGAAVRTGDEIISVDDKQFHPIRSFAGKQQKRVELKLGRAVSSEPELISVTPIILDPTTMFLDAMKASVGTTVRNGAKIGYVRIWSYAGEQYQDQLEDELDGRLHEADALVLDLRGGWGGASPNYLRPFVVPQMTTTWIMRGGQRRAHDEAWTKPVCLLIDGGTRSGKELLAYYFHKARRGPLIGSRTAGAVLVGKPFVLSDGSLLYLAVGDGQIDGQRLEGTGLTPDVEVPFELEYSDGSDPQKERAIEIMSRDARHEKS
jgi:carboxyl-terminal processing protease